MRFSLVVLTCVKNVCYSFINTFYGADKRHILLLSPSLRLDHFMFEDNLVSVAQLTFSLSSVYGLDRLTVHYPEGTALPYTNAKFAVMDGRADTLLRNFLDDPNAYAPSGWTVVNDHYQSVNGPQRYGSIGVNYKRYN